MYQIQHLSGQRTESCYRVTVKICQTNSNQKMASPILKKKNRNYTGGKADGGRIQRQKLYVVHANSEFKIECGCRLLRIIDRRYVVEQVTYYMF